MPDLEAILQKSFRLEQFRTGQREVIESVLSGHDTLAVMPTGRGKSLCYQLPALVREGVVVVVSPLISLMEDQVRSLNALGVPCGMVHSGQTRDQKQAVFAAMHQSDRFVLFLSPERVQKEGFGEWVQKQKISLFAVDESHCVSQWGPDFRKDYYRLSRLRELKSTVPILALTATATPQVLKDIVRQLGLRDPARHVYGFYRPNLYCQVESCENGAWKLAATRQALLQHPTGRVLIYCGTRKQSEELVAQLGREFPSFGYYHAGLSAEERLQIQQDYDQGRTRILAATNAFGMGIDHPNVRLVVHYQMPANIESYYQEIGRAGRDGADSTCLLLYSKKDRGLHAYFIQQSQSDAHTTRQRWRALDTIVHFVEGGECRHAGILTYFKDTFRLKRCGHCDVCDPQSQRKVSCPAPEAVSKRTPRKRTTPLSPLGPLSAEQTLRAETLRAWRKTYAETHDIPAFLVFSNKTLEDLARKDPSTEAELEAIYGLGPHKLEHLGAQILDQLSNCRG